VSILITSNNTTGNNISHGPGSLNVACIQLEETRLGHSRLAKKSGWKHPRLLSMYSTPVIVVFLSFSRGCFPGCLRHPLSTSLLASIRKPLELAAFTLSEHMTKLFLSSFLDVYTDLRYFSNGLIQTNHNIHQVLAYIVTWQCDANCSLLSGPTVTG